MSKITVSSYDPLFLNEMASIERETKERYPDFPSWATWMYEHNPELKKDNIFIAFESDKLAGYGHIIPRPAYENDPSQVPHTIYLDFNVSVDAKQPASVRDALFAALCNRTAELLKGYPDRKTELCVQHYSALEEMIEDISARGFQRVESYFLMERDLRLPIPDAPLLNGLVLREWKMETAEEKKKFLELNKLAFPDESPTLEKLEGIMAIPGWTTYAIFTEVNEVAGLIMFRSDSPTHGYIDDVFVLPEWRRQGLADALVAVGLHHLKEGGFSGVYLNVARSSSSACNLYSKAGFRAIKEQQELRLEWRGEKRSDS
ncbi:GNAT family N-acetyltransferase [Paenibacillus sp. chi10]|uniref:GNAT family N-acetyltransferase n=1 Tax=Paenibacillus suaedae TaxID=3077233 RepID=A0AAJ2N4S4_9BACL|nr:MULTISPECIES: GNAT family N-acetyltransferase [unclassified Paenibacillus]MDT8977086.1 GNAT family N-acetyltransferase [Paenibacillus sp. chi10]